MVKDNTKELKAAIKVIAKDQAALRTTMAKVLSTLSKLETIAAANEERSKNTALKVRRLIADPINNVPGELEKKVEKLTTQVKHNQAQLNVATASLSSLERCTAADVKKLKDAIATLEDQSEQTQAELEGLDDSVDDLNTQVGKLIEKPTGTQGDETTLPEEHEDKQLTLEETFASTPETQGE